MADNPSFVRIHVVGRELVAEATARSAASARATFEDLLACLQAAERAAGVATRAHTATD